MSKHAITASELRTGRAKRTRASWLEGRLGQVSWSSDNHAPTEVDKGGTVVSQNNRRVALEINVSLLTSQKGRITFCQGVCWTPFRLQLQLSEGVEIHASEHGLWDAEVQRLRMDDAKRTEELEESCNQYAKKEEAWVCEILWMDKSHLPTGAKGVDQHHVFFPSSFLWGGKLRLMERQRGRPLWSKDETKLVTQLLQRHPVPLLLVGSRQD